MSYEMLTRTGRNFYEVTSAMQNSIRKGDYEVAGYAMWELIPQYTPYLRKRLLVISAEDLFGVITKEVVNLCEIGTEGSLTAALALMCAAKKNRDADYFVCNLMYNDTPLDADKESLAKALHTAIRKMNVVDAGHLSAALFKKNRKRLWEMLTETAMLYYPHLSDEIAALWKANEMVSKPAEETIFVAKAICLMWTIKEPKEAILGYPGMQFDGLLDIGGIITPKTLDECQKIKGLFPDWSYNWHTTHGKYHLRRDAVHAIDNDQRLLHPLEENLFDDCSWNRDLNFCLQKWNPRNFPVPYNDGKRDPGEKYGTKE